MVTVTGVRAQRPTRQGEGRRSGRQLSLGGDYYTLSAGQFAVHGNPAAIFNYRTLDVQTTNVQRNTKTTTTTRDGSLVVLTTMPCLLHVCLPSLFASLSHLPTPPQPPPLLLLLLMSIELDINFKFVVTRDCRQRRLRQFDHLLCSL